MSVVEIASLIPVTELVKLVISMAKKVKDFKPLFKELASTMKRLVPIIQEMEILQERVHPGNEELNFLTETVRRAEKMVSKCSRVREYNALKKISYAETIKGINEDFVKFCQLDLPLIQHRNMLRSLSLKMEDGSPPRPEHNSNVSTSDQGKGKRVQDQEDEQLAAVLQESQKSIFGRRQQELQQVILESCKDKGKGKQVHDQEDEQLAAVLQESQKSISGRRQEELQQVILESCKDKGKGKQVQDQEDEQLAAILQESQKSIFGRRQQELQQVILESCKDKGKGKQVQEDEQVATAYQESLNMEELDHLARRKPIFHSREEQQVILESCKDKRKGKQLQEDEQLAAAFQERLNMEDDDLQRILLESFKNKANRKAI